VYCIVFYFTVFLFYFFSVEYFGVGEGFIYCKNNLKG
jgi:hypothetical protein